jgi:hypothetical protein
MFVQNCNNYRKLSPSSTTHQILSSILLSRFTPKVDEIFVDRQCGFRCNRTGTNQIFCIRQIFDNNGNRVQQYTSYL